MPAPFTTVCLVGALCGAILGLGIVVAVALTAAIGIEGLFFYLAGANGGLGS